VSGTIGNILIAAGVALALLGVVVKTGALDWFGRLPGDIRIVRESTRIYFPWVSMLVISLVLSGVAQLIARWFRDR
jgi:di/tricarboxylate transporter